MDRNLSLSLDVLDELPDRADLLTASIVSGGEGDLCEEVADVGDAGSAQMAPLTGPRLRYVDSRLGADILLLVLRLLE